MHNFTHILTDIENQNVNELINKLEKIFLKNLLTSSECQYSYLTGLQNLFHNDNDKVFQIYTNSNLSFIKK